MLATRPLLAKGFWGRSVDELKRLSHIGMLPPSPSFTQQ